MKKLEIKSASMLVTNNGYCVKVMLLNGSDICFFTDKEMNHRTWNLTEKKPEIILDHREFHRLRDRVGLEEISLTATQMVIAIEIAEKVLADPYHGFGYGWRKKHNIPTTEEYKRRNSSGQSYGIKMINAKVEKSTLGDHPELQALKQKFA